MPERAGKRTSAHVPHAFLKAWGDSLVTLDAGLLKFSGLRALLLSLWCQVPCLLTARDHRGEHEASCNAGS